MPAEQRSLLTIDEFIDKNYYTLLHIFKLTRKYLKTPRPL